MITIEDIEILCQINLKLKFVNCNQAPSMPLETAEQFLLTLGSISNLEARLKLWTFKLDFKVGAKRCKQFQYLISISDQLKGDGKRHM